MNKGEERRSEEAKKGPRELLELATSCWLLAVRFLVATSRRLAAASRPQTGKRARGKRLPSKGEGEEFY